jgi:group II intron reverse transcriptase/maturase
MKLLSEGREWIVDVDIRKYFDTVNHELLLEAVNEEVSDGSVLRLLRMFLESGVMENGKRMATEEGTPQGGVISPLLANIYLNRLDWEMAREGYEVIRYADDFVVMCASEEEARQAYEEVRNIIEGELRLQLHPEKTRVVYHEESPFEFVGFLVHRRYLWPRIKSLDRFKDRVRILTRRQQPRNVREVIKNLSSTLRGFGNYFRIADVQGLFGELDAWIRMRLRCFMEKKRAVKFQNRRIPNRTFASMGLVSLEALRLAYRSLPETGQPYAAPSL